MQNPALQIDEIMLQRPMSVDADSLFQQQKHNKQSSNGLSV